jgi:hypothetical protein
VQQPEEHPQQCGLPGAVGAENAVDLAGGDAQRDVVDRDQLALLLGDAVHLDGQLRVHAGEATEAKVKDR